ncbi:tumor necrosis factor receptor superfamily member 9 [Rana temporaria]|uniref:tumor necrosis factor receptor superfamily member 9 n=1 Tax=Rana temporaria TaxID=8407 RepID=UPI001AAC61ED|nr:tumor necrosis factor receptor superfamily member 9 [Rana temporaria]XP_040182507.1 tumor necrosis factor receptor superfamily member 9 [Rana temporaria]
MKRWCGLSVFLCVLWSHLCDRGVQGEGCRTQHSGCCVLCHPGYFLNKKCGLCRPCPSNGYMDHPSAEPDCKRCEKCEGIFEYRSNCSPTKNALCKCIAGKKCADEKCSQCEDNSCPAGTQLNGEDCVNCPSGTFNPGWEGSCRPWKNCSEINAVIYVNGTMTSDVVCLPKPTQTPPTSPAVATTTPQDLPSYNQSVIIVVVSVVCVIIAFIAVFWCLSKRLERIKNTFVKIKHTEQEDACSCHYPEEEHGGEEETLSSEP